MFTIGCDPEFFGHDGAREVSVIGKVGGTKEEPQRTQHGWIQEDNVAAEINIIPANSLEEFKSNIHLVVGDLQEVLAKHKLVLSDRCFAEFQKHELRHKKARQSGCDPDYNAWIDAMNEAPSYKGLKTRACGGHVHIGHEFKDRYETLSFVRLLDLFLAVPAVMVEDVRRKELYGRAGCHRVKNYGVEYRTLSNFWLFKDEYIERVYRGVELAFENLGKVEPPPWVVDIINSNDKDGAAMIMKEHGIPAF